MSTPSPSDSRPHLRLRLELIVALISVSGVVMAALISFYAISEASRRQAEALERERIWTERVSAYSKAALAATERQTLIARLAIFEEHPDVPDGRSERLKLLERARTSQAGLEGSLTRVRLIGAQSVHEPLNLLVEALDQVVSSDAGYGASVGCTPILGSDLFQICGRFVDATAPLDEQALATVFVEKGELEALDKAIKSFVNAGAKDLRPE